MSSKSNNSKINNKMIKGIDLVGHIARNNLERFGAVLDSVNAKSGKASQFKAVDLSNYKTGNASNLLSQQTLKTSQQLIGGRFATYGKFAKKVVPDSIFQKVTDGAFSQVAKLAATWSQIDLPSGQRFEGIEQLNDQQRHALARDIANQNRALATLGGVTGLAGLPGMLADTLWLLLVSLRTVYQLATVYGKPLTGKQGVKMAYAVLSHADLSKMQEKQTILAALGVAQGLVSNVEHTSLSKELSKGLGLASTNIKFYAEQIDKLVEQFNIDIDNINLSWLSKVLPVIAVGTTVHFNSYLIDQVIGVTKATFGPEPIVGKKNIANDSASQQATTNNASQGSKPNAKPEQKTETNTTSETKDQAASNIEAVKTESSDSSKEQQADETQVSANNKVEKSSSEPKEDNK